MSSKDATVIAMAVDPTAQHHVVADVVGAEVTRAIRSHHRVGSCSVARRVLRRRQAVLQPRLAQRPVGLDYIHQVARYPDVKLPESLFQGFIHGGEESAVFLRILHNKDQPRIVIAINRAFMFPNAAQHLTVSH